MALTGNLAKYFLRKIAPGRSEYNIYSLTERNIALKLKILLRGCGGNFRRSAKNFSGHYRWYFNF